MRIIGFEAENWKRLQAVQITPEGNVVVIGGDNDAGKSSILDAIWIALEGKTASIGGKKGFPIRPIRDGEEEARIKLDMGEIVVTRRFRYDDKGEITEQLRVTNAEGLKYPKQQQVLDSLLGAIGFDPFAFMAMKPADQSATLRELVPLSVDLDELAEADKADYDARRDINRDATALRNQIEAIDLPAKLPELIDRDAIEQKLADASKVAADIERDRNARAEMLRVIETRKRTAEQDRERIDEVNLRIRTLEDEIAELCEIIVQKQTDAKAMDDRAAELQAEHDKLPPLAEPVDTDALRHKLREAETIAAVHASAERKRVLIGQFNGLKKQSEDITKAMADREQARKDALATAEMPIDGLGIEIIGDEHRVTFEGVPFEQAGTATQLRVSTAIAMAANPTLRVLRIKDGSLLGPKAMQMLAEMADDQDYQLWIERVGSGDAGIIIEDGMVKPDGEAVKTGEPIEEKAEATQAKPKASKPKAKAAKDGGSLL